MIVTGAKNRKGPDFVNVVGAMVFGTIGGFLLGGPPGALAGAIQGAAMAIAREGAKGLAEITHPELFNEGATVQEQRNMVIAVGPVFSRRP